MTDKSKRPKERDGITSALNAAIEALNLAKEISSITPAKAVFGSVSIILAAIRVSFLPVNVFLDQLQTEIHPGRDGQPDRLRRTWAELRRCLCRPRPGIEWEGVGRP